ncbi:MAG: GNAT family N-acetyltransferase [Ruminococcaceae bacterium]|nr:GNAT family N-acetyltransferase [Oscillospiraceae bacterium]
MVEIKTVKTAKDIKEFINFPLRLYRDCPFFVPPLYGDEKKLLRAGACGDMAESVFYLAVREGKTVGRIQGLIQKQYNQNHNKRQVRFTRFDSIDDSAVSNALFAAVEKWGAERGMNELCGPLGYCDLDREGLLVEGFEEDATFEEQYNYAYYGALVEKAGLQKDVDWLEFELRRPEKKNEMLARAANRTLEINKLHVASTKMSKRKYIEKYRDSFFDCLDECYRHLYGTVPIDKETQEELIRQFMLILHKEYLILICDEREQVVGFGLCFPSIGKAVKKSGGRLTLPALCRLLKAVRSPKVIDLGLVAVRPKYQLSGVNAVILNTLLEAMLSGRLQACETNLNLETNTAVLSQWRHFSARQHKRRRSYMKKIGE